MDIKPIQLFCNLLYQKSNHETLSSRNNDGTEMCHVVQNQALSAKQLVKRRELHCVKDWEFNLTKLIHNKKLVQKKMNEQVGTGNFLVGNPTRSLQTQPRTKRQRSIRRNFDRQLNCLITQSTFKTLRWIACQWRLISITGFILKSKVYFCRCQFGACKLQCKLQCIRDSIKYCHNLLTSLISESWATNFAPP